HPLQNPELNIRRIQSLGIKERKIFNLLESILMLPKGAITLDFSGIKVSGPWGKKIPLAALGDGYHATINWIIDMFGWKSLHEGKKRKLSIDRILNISGIILLDEIEQHLHPKWQKRIIKSLRNHFPKLQFIVTTHSPLTVIGTTELEDEECSIIVLEQRDNFVEERITLPPRGKRVDQVLTSYMFDLYTASDDAIKHDIERYQHLYQIERTKDEEKEMHAIIQRLDEQLDSAETDLEKLVEGAVQQTLEKLSHDYVDKEKSGPKPTDFELRRQLGQLFK
ncbi:MAG: AAA family ATPase, partial [Candidatus Marinimicrobia bacterium]|nr:AAA family ATPase [Candidatus Neomarinimicrobiota bacterium]